MSSAADMATMRKLVALGVKEPAEWDNIQRAYKAATDHNRHREEALTALRETIEAGSFAAAAQAAGRASKALVARGDEDVRRVAESAMASGMLRALDPAKAHRQLAKLYTEAGQALHAALDACGDADSPPEHFLKRKQHAAAEAWAAVPDLARDVERFAEGLVLVARLGGIFIDRNDLRQTMPLLVTCPEALREDVLRAWTPGRDERGVTIPHGRAGRFGALVAAGARLEAPALDKWQRWEEPPAPPRPQARDNRAIARAMR